MRRLFGDLFATQRQRTSTKFLLRSLIARFFSKRWPPELSGLIISPGGVATTTVINYLSDSIRMNSHNDLDGLKHVPAIPPKLLREGIPILFISGDEDEIVMSLSRRRIVVHQAIKLWPKFRLSRLRQLVGSPELALRQGIRLQSAAMEAAAGKVLVIPYEELFERKEAVCAHLGVSDAEVIKHFPPRIDRTGEA